MIHRKTLRKKQPKAAMTLKKAKEIFKTMSHLHAKRKFSEYKNAYKYLLTLANHNEFCKLLLMYLIISIVGYLKLKFSVFSRY